MQTPPRSGKAAWRASSVFSDVRPAGIFDGPRLTFAPNATQPARSGNPPQAMVKSIASLCTTWPLIPDSRRICLTWSRSWTSKRVPGFSPTSADARPKKSKSTCRWSFHGRTETGIGCRFSTPADPVNAFSHYPGAFSGHPSLKFWGP